MASLRHNPAAAGLDSPRDGYLDAARACILDVGWRRTTLTEVARRAGVSRMTIYRTWPERFAWAYINEMKHFVECIQQDRAPRVGGEDGRLAVAGVLAGTKSLLEERPVYIREVLETKEVLAER